MFNLQADGITAMLFTPLQLHLEVDGRPGPQAAWRDLPELREVVGELLLHWLDPRCREAAGHLLQDLTACRLAPGQLEVTRCDGSEQQAPLPVTVWADLCAALVSSPDPPDRRASQVVEKVGELLEREVLDFQAPGPNMNAGVVEELRRTLTHVGGAVPDADLQASWEHHHQLQLMVHGTGEPAVRLSQQQLPPALLEEILTSQDSALQSALADAEPACTLCGECCRRFAVEIQPSDITRLSAHLGLNYAQFVEAYTGPGYFSWNLQTRTLNKQRAAQRLQLALTQPEAMDCVFLKRDPADGLTSCQVHSHRPDICRGFEPNNRLCREVNHRAHPERQAGQLNWVEISSTEIRVQTHRREAGRYHPLVFARSRWPRLDQAAWQLEGTPQQDP